MVDIDSHLPLAGALVTLAPEPAGIFPGTYDGASGLATTARVAITDSVGAYLFTRLASGRYGLAAVRPGYRPYSVVVELRTPAAWSVALGLAIEPIPLEPLRLVARQADPFPRGRHAHAGTGLASGHGFPWPAYPLPTDAVELTRDEVREAVTAAEPDLFRAIQRLPGIATLTDYTAGLWTRGAAWSQTRVYIDGIPVFDPLHGLGTLTGINPEAVGALWVHPGVHPVALPEGAAGAIELKTRRGSSEGRLGAVANVSLLTMEAALDQASRDGRAAWMLSVRHSSLDWLTRMLGRAAGEPDLHVPYEFWDAVGRVDLRLGPSQLIEASALGAGDYWRGRDADAAPRGDATWENVVARVSLTSTWSDIEARHTLGISRRTGRIRRVGASPFSDEPGPLWPDVAPPTSSGISYMSLAGEWRPAPPRSAGWAGGYDLVRQAAAYDGEAATGLPVGVVARWSPGSLALESRPVWIAGAWLERTWSPSNRLTVQPALRVELAERVLASGPVRAAPRLTARYQIRPDVTLSASLGRTWQYAQSLAPAGVRKASLASDHIWLVGPAAPAVRADIATAGADLWLAGVWRITANGFLRRSDGLAFPDPAPGPVTAPRALFVVGRGRAVGFEIAARRVAPRWNAFVGYSLARSSAEAGGLRFPASADRRHVLDATAMLRLTSALSVGGALSAASGPPYTRVEQEVMGQGSVSRLGPPNSERGPTYASLDLLLEWSGALLGRRVGAYAQLRNALGRDNYAVYVNSQPGCVPGWCGPRAILETRYEKGLPRLPVVGFRVRF